jgi:FMN phosphatase YigB (HAD superfamily)
MTTQTIYPHELAGALERSPEAKILSLDCFDTLLWRDCHAPADVFDELTALNQGQRGFAEAKARRIEAARHGRTEVGLRAIYREALSNADRAVRQRALEEELAAEARLCFGFRPTVELMREARARGLRIVLVSDTYLAAGELRNLVEQSAGPDVAGHIDHFFVSSEAGISKSEGLFAHVLKALKCRPNDILHIGDNRIADHDGARALGIPALHLVQFTDAARQRLRLERACGKIADACKDPLPANQPHRAIIAEKEPTIASAAEGLGFATLGPVFHAFDRWLAGEAQRLADLHGGTVHKLFLLRDGYLPLRIHEAGGAARNAHAIEISRFTAGCAALTSSEAVARHLALEGRLNPTTLARQMLFDEDEIARFCGEDTSKAARALQAELRTGTRQKIVRRRSRAFAARLVRHVEQIAAPKPGDTLVLIDLGYNGTVQNRIAGLLEERLGVHVAGRYLLLHEKEASGLDKRGLLDARSYDPALLDAMCGNVAVLEQLATAELGSVVDYAEDGSPIRKSSGVKGAQSQVREAVQRGCLAFCESALAPPMVRTGREDLDRPWQHAAASALLRFLFLPQPSELAVLREFEHDVNLGSTRMVSLFDPAEAQSGMRRRGLFYMKGASRMYLPAELAQEELSVRLSLLAQNRFGLQLNYLDHAPEGDLLPAIYVKDGLSSRSDAPARPTHDGYRAVRLPVGAEGGAVALQLGGAYEWVELAEITCSPIAALAGAQDAPPVALAVELDGLAERGPGIFECLTPESLALMIVPPSEQDGGRMVEIVLRPLRMRGQGGATAGAEAPVSHGMEQAA